jgi:hypothetical protein
LQSRGDELMPIKMLSAQGDKQRSGWHSARIRAHSLNLSLRITPDEYPLRPLRNVCDIPYWHRLSPSTFEGSLGDFTVIEVSTSLSQDLIIFMSLASNDDGVPWLGQGDGVFDGLLTIGQGHIVCDTFYPTDNRVKNVQRVLRARIV